MILIMRLNPCVVLRHAIVFAPVVLACSAAPAQDAAPPAHELVATQVGQLPIILSAPHGGLAVIPGVAARKGDGLVKGPSGFVAARDGGTEELALALAVALENKMGKKPYLVAA